MFINVQIEDHHFVVQISLEIGGGFSAVIVLFRGLVDDHGAPECGL